MERRKFTYRYDEETEELLNKAMQNFGFSSMNKLIDKLIVDALVDLPKHISYNEKQITTLTNDLSNARKDKVSILKEFKTLKELIIQEQEVKKKIESLIKQEFN